MFFPLRFDHRIRTINAIILEGLFQNRQKWEEIRVQFLTTAVKMKKTTAVGFNVESLLYLILQSVQIVQKIVPKRKFKNSRKAHLSIQYHI